MSYQSVYIARHGLTEANIAKYVQDAFDPLAEQGHLQAERLAERASNLSFKHLLASDMVRAKQTADCISKRTGHDIVTVPLLREVMRPTSLHGLARESAEYQAFLALDIKEQGNEQFRFEDGENFFDLRNRALAALEQFASYGADPVLAVSHGLFLKYVAATVITAGKLTPDVWSPMVQSLIMHNTGITVLHRDTETNQWFLVSWNDHAHFADD